LIEKEPQRRGGTKLQACSGEVLKNTENFLFPEGEKKIKTGNYFYTNKKTYAQTKNPDRIAGVFAFMFRNLFEHD
jgi:hypothetical protein